MKLADRRGRATVGCTTESGLDERRKHAALAEARIVKPTNMRAIADYLHLQLSRDHGE